MSLGLKFDPSQSGLRKVLREYEELALSYFWDKDAVRGTSREVWAYVNGRLGESEKISRTTIINFLKAMADNGVLNSREEAGKGGYHAVYSAYMDKRGFIKNVAISIFESLIKDFP